MEQLLEQYHGALSHYHAIECAARFHLMFESIHPFIDGNGRTGHFTLFSDGDVSEINSIIRNVEQRLGSGSFKQGDVFPTNTALTITSQEHATMKWGFPKFGWRGYQCPK